MQNIHEKKKKEKRTLFVCELTDIIGYKRSTSWKHLTATWPGVAQNFEGELLYSRFILLAATCYLMLNSLEFKLFQSNTVTITNALMNNSEFSLYQQKDNLELSAAECIFQEIKKSTGFPCCLLCSLPLLHAFLHRQEFWDLATD